MDTSVIHITFWTSLLALTHAYILYPVSLSVIPVRADSQSSSADSESELPTVTIAIAAYNECGIIETKLKNTLTLDYPRDRLQIVVVSDGSTDCTDAIVRTYADRGVDLLRVEGRVGKTACQNRLVSAVESEIVVFSDATSLYDSAAIRALVDGFGPDIGCVVGNLRHVDAGKVYGEHLYWRYEQFIKRLESRVSTLVTGTGPIYAVRRTSYVPLPSEAISDFAEPLAIVEHGERVQYAPDAVAWERMSGSVLTELRRRVRIATRMWHTGFRWKQLFNPVARPIIAYQLFSHRGLLGLTPFLLVLLVASTVALVVTDGGIFYGATLGFQLAVYSLALVGGVIHWLDLPTVSIIDILYYFVFANIGLIIGLTYYLCGKTIVAWETIDRSVE